MQLWEVKRVFSSKIIWSEFFTKKKELISDSSLDFEDPGLAEGKQVADIVLEDVKEDLEHCKDLVIGTIVGKKLPYMLVKNTLQRAWRPKGLMHMTIHGESLYVFEFDDESDRIVAIEYGLVYNSQQLFFVRPWHPLIEQEIAEMKIVLVWVNLRKVPLHMWNSKALSKIASVIAKPIMMDKLTATRARMSFARVLIEISVDCEYPSSVPVFYEGKHVVDVSVEYPWKAPKCNACNSFGHVAVKCPWAKPKENVVEAPKKTDSVGNQQAWVVKGSRKSKSQLDITSTTNDVPNSEQVSMEEVVVSPEGNKENVFMEEEQNVNIPTASKFDALLEMFQDSQNPVNNSGIPVISGINGSSGATSGSQYHLSYGGSKGKSFFKGKILLVCLVWLLKDQILRNQGLLRGILLP